MSAEDLGKRVLEEVECEGLDELLASLRLLHDPASAQQIGIPQIDALLDVFTAPQQPLRPVQRHFSPNYTDDNDHVVVPPPPRIAPIKARAPPIIELTSPGTNDGKTQLLYYITATSILPKDVGPVQFGGQDAAVVVFDTESRFSVPRLVQVIKNYIQTRLAAHADASKATEAASAATGKLTLKQINQIIEEALKHVHIYRPQSLASLTATVKSLPQYLLNTTAHFSANKRLGLIMLDSASSFFYQDRADVEALSLPTAMTTTNLPTTTNSNVSISTGTTTTDTAAAAAVVPVVVTTTSSTTRSKPQSGYITLASALRKASAKLGAPIIYTASTFSPLPKPSSDPNDYSSSNKSIRPHLPSPWPSLPTLRLVIHRRQTRKFPLGMNAEEVVAQKGSREANVRKGVFEVGVNGYEAGEWGDRILEGVRRVGGFEIRATSEGVFLL